MGCWGVSLRKFGRRIAFSVSAVIVFTAAPSVAAPPLETALKATFLVKFAPFVDWPPAVFDSPSSPVTICVLADDALAGPVQQAANGQKDGNRPLAVRRIAEDENTQGCQIFYFSPDDEAGAQIAQNLQGRPVLTVTSSAGAPQANADVTFVLDQNRVRFDIDNAAAQRAGLRIGSNLLALARNVKSAP